MSWCWGAYVTYGEVRGLLCSFFASSVSYSHCFACSSSRSIVPWREFQIIRLTFLRLFVCRNQDPKGSDSEDRLVKLSHLCLPSGIKRLGSIQDMSYLTRRAANSTFAFVALVSLQQPPGAARSRRVRWRRSRPLLSCPAFRRRAAQRE